MLTGEALTEGATTRSIPENTKTTTSRFLRQHLKELIHQETHKGGVCKFPKGGAGMLGLIPFFLDSRSGKLIANTRVDHLVHWPGPTFFIPIHGL